MADEMTPGEALRAVTEQEWAAAHSWHDLSASMRAPYERRAAEALALADAIRAKMRAAQDAQAGWIEWIGGERPVPGETRVDLRLRDGSCYSHAAASMFRWEHYDPYWDIITYRIIKESAP